MRRLSAPAAWVMGECAYAAISFSAFVVAPVAFAVSGFPVPPLFSIPSETDLAPNQPVSRVSATSCRFLSQALDALAVQRSRSAGFAHWRFKRLTIPTAEVRCGPYVLSRNAMSVVSFTGFPDPFLVLSHSPPPLDSRRPKC
jgi:hypothetical protein